MQLLPLKTQTPKWKIFNKIPITHIQTHEYIYTRSILKCFLVSRACKSITQKSIFQQPQKARNAQYIKKTHFLQLPYIQIPT